MSYQQRAVYVMKLFLDGFSVKELTDFANAAYGPEKFDTPAVAPVRALDSNTFCLELWHGPTCAFKDMALQMLPHLLTASLRKLEEEKTVCILVATSGDTGKGALEGFRDVDHTKNSGVLPQGRGLRHPGAPDGHPGGRQRGGLLGVRQLRRRPDGGEAAFLRREAAGGAGPAGLLPVLRQLHQLGPGAASGGLLHLRLLRPAPGWTYPAGGPHQCVCAHRQFRQHPGGLLRPGHGGAHPPADLRLQRQQCAHRLPAHRRV